MEEWTGREIVTSYKSYCLRHEYDGQDQTLKYTNFQNKLRSYHTIEDSSHKLRLQMVLDFNLSTLYLV